MAIKPLKAVVVYFTLSGHTQAAAESVAAALDADFERIEAAKPLPSNMFVLLAVGGFAATMKRAWTARPAALKFGDYDLVIIGTPIWAWSLNPVVRGWLRANPIPAEIPYAAFATVGGPTGSGAFDEMAAIVGRTPFATMMIHDAETGTGSAGGSSAAGRSAASGTITRIVSEWNDHGNLNRNAGGGRPEL
jgi:flavodoxin-like protein